MPIAPHVDRRDHHARDDTPANLAVVDRIQGHDVFAEMELAVRDYSIEDDVDPAAMIEGGLVVLRLDLDAVDPQDIEPPEIAAAVVFDLDDTRLPGRKWARTQTGPVGLVELPRVEHRVERLVNNLDVIAGGYVCEGITHLSGPYTKAAEVTHFKHSLDVDLDRLLDDELLRAASRDRVLVHRPKVLVAFLRNPGNVAHRNAG